MIKFANDLNKSILPFQPGLPFLRVNLWQKSTTNITCISGLTTKNQHARLFSLPNFVALVKNYSSCQVDSSRSVPEKRNASINVEDEE